jgi:uracil-DNA glycosylase
LFEEHRERVRACERCFPQGGNAPVVDVAQRTRVLLVAQAPGATEARVRVPFVGPADRRLEGWFDRVGISREDVYLSALARCFPGHDLQLPIAPARRVRAAEAGDSGAGRRARHKELLGIARLSEAVGRTHRRDGVVYVPLPHPSGASTWLNAPENEERLWRSLAMLRDLMISNNLGETDA